MSSKQNNSFILSVGFNPPDETQRELLLYLMMTSCDLSDQVKPFDSASAAAVSKLSIFSCVNYAAPIHQRRTFFHSKGHSHMT